MSFDNHSVPRSDRLRVTGSTGVEKTFLEGNDLNSIQYHRHMFKVKNNNKWHITHNICLNVTKNKVCNTCHWTGYIWQPKERWKETWSNICEEEDRCLLSLLSWHMILTTLGEILLDVVCWIKSMNTRTLLIMSRLVYIPLNWSVRHFSSVRHQR